MLWHEVEVVPGVEGCGGDRVTQPERRGLRSDDLDCHDSPDVGARPPEVHPVRAGCGVPPVVMSVPGGERGWVDGHLDPA